MDTVNSSAMCPPTPAPTPAPMAPLEIKPEAVISSVDGIQFGLWVPSLISDGTISINIRNSFYVKVEKLVICTFDIVITGISGGKNNSEVTLAGLPHASITSQINSGSLFTSYFKTTNNDVQNITGTVKSFDTKVDLWCQKRNTVGLNRLVHLDINIDTVLTGTVTYITP